MRSSLGKRRPGLSDLDRLKQEYASRKARLAGRGLYSSENRAHSYTLQQRHATLQDLLNHHGIDPLSGLRILEIGCGGGGVLEEFQELGVEQASLFGIDLLFDRLQEANDKLPKAGISNADAQDLPFPPGSFDIVLQYTAFSSVLDFSIRERMAAEMLRVLKKNGTIIWYDFWWNPINRQTRGILPSEIKALYPGCCYNFKKITLAPPIARIAVPLSKRLAFFLESLKLMNSHYLVFISREDHRRTQ